jgi:hypothetical protein
MSGVVLCEREFRFVAPKVLLPLSPYCRIDFRIDFDRLLLSKFPHLTAYAIRDPQFHSKYFPKSHLESTALRSETDLSNEFRSSIGGTIANNDRS